MPFQATLGLLLSVSLVASPFAPLHAVAPPPPAPGDDPSALSEEDRLARAKELYAEGDAAYNAGEFETALARFEEAYDVYAPTVHLFNFNIGLAAFGSGDCVKAETSLKRFLDLVPNHPARGEAQERLIEIERSGCAKNQPEPEPEPVETVPYETESAPVTDNDDAPILESKSQQRERAAEAERAERDRGKRPLLIAGVVTLVIGLAATGTGVGFLVLADRGAERLASLASSGPTGFPAGDYSDDDVFNLDRNLLPAYNATAPTLLIVGGLAAVTGIALIAVDGAKHKRSQGETAGFGRRWTAGPTVLRAGGGLTAGFQF